MATTGDTVPPPASSDGVLRITELETRRIEGTKIEVPKQLKGDEQPARAAMIFYLTAAKLEGEDTITDGGKLRALAENVNQTHPLNIYLQKMNDLITRELEELPFVFRTSGGLPATIGRCDDDGRAM